MKSRWCKVISPRFDHMIAVNKMLSADQESILYLPEPILSAGILAGKLKRIDRPPGYRVDKAGRVTCSSTSRTR